MTRLIPALLVALIAFAGIPCAVAPALGDPAPQSITERATGCPTDGAREGESLDARIARLERERVAVETALRLARHERVVRKKGKPSGR